MCKSSKQSRKQAIKQAGKQAGQHLGGIMWCMDYWIGVLVITGFHSTTKTYSVVQIQYSTLEIIVIMNMLRYYVTCLFTHTKKLQK